MAKNVLELKNVTKAYEPAEGIPAVRVLNGINLEISAGDSVAIVGPSGSGKSTLLNIIGTLDRPSSGEVILEGNNISNASEIELAQIRNLQIGFIFQAHHLLPQCSVLENVLVPTLATKDPKIRQGAEERARQVLEKVGLTSRLTHRPGQLSGGERQRVAVARALINQPRLILADEPTGALDRSSAQNLGELLVTLNAREGVTLILVTHALDLAHRMKRVVELKDGQLVKS